MATTYKIQGNPTNILPWATVNGQITAFDVNTEIYSWSPNTNYAGTALEFNIEIYCDAVLLGLDPQIITVTSIIADAINDTYITRLNTSITGNVSTNDILCSTGLVTFQLNTNSVNGNFLVNPNGSFTFTPNNGFIGAATGTYDILCNGVVKDSATITVTITGIGNQLITFCIPRNNCPANTFPECVTYTIPANTVIDNTVESANWKAYQAALSTAQSNANILGKCNSGGCIEAPCVDLLYVNNCTTPEIKITPRSIGDFNYKVCVEQTDLTYICTTYPGNLDNSVTIMGEWIKTNRFYVIAVDKITGIESNRQCTLLNYKSIYYEEDSACETINCGEPSNCSSAQTHYVVSMQDCGCS